MTQEAPELRQRRGKVEIHLPCSVAVIAGGCGLFAVTAMLGWVVTVVGALWLLVFAGYRYLSPSMLSRRQRKAAVVWAIFGLFGGLLAPGVAYLSRVLGAADSHPVRHGDLFLVGSLLCFLGAGTMVQSEGRKLNAYMAVVVGGAMALGMLDLTAFNIVSGSSHASSLGVNVASMVLYTGSAVSNLGCNLVALVGESADG